MHLFKIQGQKNTFQVFHEIAVRAMVLLCGANVSLALAEETAKASSASFGGMLWFSFVSLMLGAALILLVAWLVRRNTEIKLPSRHTQVLLQHPLGPRERVVVVKVLNRVLVLGQTPTQINLLTELDPDEITDLVDPVGEAVLSNPFSKYFRVKAK